MKDSIQQRLLSKVDARNYHWLWTGAKNDKGYGQLNVVGQDEIQRRVYAHRLSYELFVSPIPEGKELDHLCRLPACICPWHLEAVTHQVNVLRGFSTAAIHARKTRCINGHELSGQNVWINSKNSRVCLTCRRNRDAKFRKLHPGYADNYR